MSISQSSSLEIDLPKLTQIQTATTTTLTSISRIFVLQLPHSTTGTRKKIGTLEVHHVQKEGKCRNKFETEYLSSAQLLISARSSCTTRAVSTIGQSSLQLDRRLTGIVMHNPPRLRICHASMKERLATYANQVGRACYTTHTRLFHHLSRSSS